MDVELKLFLDELLHQLVKLNKNVEYISDQFALQKEQRERVIRKAENGFDKLS